MATSETQMRGIFSLPNEILLSIFSLLPTRPLLDLTTTCHHIHTLIMRVVHHRLQIAASLDGHTLYLECHHPSVRLTASEFFCTSLGTDGLQDLMSQLETGGCETPQGRTHKVSNLYSRFRPQRREPEVRWWRRPGDVPGSRTHPESNGTSTDNSATAEQQEEDVVSETVTVDAHDLFSQLETQAYLGKREPTRGFLSTIHPVCEGTIRVWRDWLSRQCERKKWTDGEAVVVQRGPPSGPAISSANEDVDLTKDPSILWINTRKDNVGIRFRVKEQKWRRANPILYASENEVAVSYLVDLEEVLVRTTHLLLKLEEAQRQVDNRTGKAIVFGSFAGLHEFETSGLPAR